MTTLFVNACVRGEASRTLALCRDYLSASKGEVEEVNLAALHLKPFDADMVRDRGAKAAAAAWDDPMFALARQFASADEIVVGAPFWDLSFPSVLKVYIEHICVGGLTFHYTEDSRCEGLCHARRLTYITTCGGSVGNNLGYDYVRGIAGMLGIPETRFVAAENLDMVGVDVEAQLAQARERVRELAEQ